MNPTITFLTFLTFLLLILIFQWIDYLVKNNYVAVYQEGLKTKTFEDDTSANHNTVDMPLNTTTSCTNMCGPQNRCSISGQQCFADIDCPGCEPQTSTPTDHNQTRMTVGENDSGKLTTGTAVNYSELTSDIGSRARLIVSNKYEKPVTLQGKINTWDETFNLSKSLFDDRYKPTGLSGMPSYRKTYTLSGEFIDEGPLASNSYLS